MLLPDAVQILVGKANLVREFEPLVHSKRDRTQIQFPGDLRGFAGSKPGRDRKRFRVGWKSLACVGTPINDERQAYANQDDVSNGRLAASRIGRRISRS